MEERKMPDIRAYNSDVQKLGSGEIGSNRLITAHLKRTYKRKKPR